MSSPELEKLIDACNEAIEIQKDHIVVKDALLLEQKILPILLENAESAVPAVRDLCAWIIRSLGQTKGCGFASLVGLNRAMDAGGMEGRSLPVITCSFAKVSTLRAVLETAAEMEVGPLVFGLEIRADSNPSQLSSFFSALTCAAILEHWQLPLITALVEEPTKGGGKRMLDLASEAVSRGYVNFFCREAPVDEVLASAAQSCPSWMQPFATGHPPGSTLNLDNVSPESVQGLTRDLVASSNMADSLALLKIHTIPKPFSSPCPIQL